MGNFNCTNPDCSKYGQAFTSYVSGHCPRCNVDASLPTITPKMFTVTIVTSDINTGKRFSNRVDVAAKHELEARSLAFSALDDLLMGANILTVDIIENLDRVSNLSVTPV